MHFDSNVFFLLLLGVAALFKWLAQRAQESKEDSDTEKREETSHAGPTSAPAGSEEERIRRFLEALGQPSSSPPPPKVVPRPAKRVVLPRVGPSLPPLISQPPVLEPTPPLTTMVPPPLPSFATPRVAPLPIETPAFEVRRSQPVSSSRDPAAAFPSPVPLTTSAIRTLLATSDGSRQAMILREIFGPPRCLQEQLVDAI